MRKVFWQCGLLFMLTATSCAGTAGSLYNEANFRSPVADRKAYRVGDSLTVLIFENASASASADTTTQKKGGIGLSITTPNTDKAATVGISDDFGGHGKIQRTGKVLAQLTVTVESLEPNGDLNVKGDQLIVVNGEKQAITLEGRVRLSDISDVNTVASNRIANARISYVGDGILGEKQHAGILTRVFSWLGLL